MLERVVAFATTQRLFVLVLTGALAAFGIRAALNVPIEAFPDVQDVQVQVVTQYAGQAPEEVERAVTLPIEREMAGVPQLTSLRSVSITGLSVVTLTFADGADDYFVRQQVLEKLQGVTLPPNVQPTLAPLATAVGEIYRYVLDAPAGMPDYEVRALQDWTIRPGLRTVAGVADVVSFGGSVKEYQVRVDPHALKRYGITLDQVSNALSAGNSNTGGGLLPRGEESLVVRGIGLVRSLDDIRATAVASRAGRPVLVADVAAEVAIGRRARSGIVAFNERDSVVEGIVLMTKGQNAAKVVQTLRSRVAELQARLPPGVRIAPVYERTQLIHHTVRTVAENLGLGAALVIAVLVAFLRSWRLAMIIASVIPLSLAAAFIMIDARGISANLISLGAIDFGIIIDGAVVLAEAFLVRLAVERAQPVQALRNTALELGPPILFAKAIIITAFLPIFTFQRVEGKIFAPVAYTLSFALAGALLLTLTFVPALLAHAARGGLAERESAWMHALQQHYRRLIAVLSGHRRAVLGGSVALLAAALACAPLLGTEFLPKLDEGNIWLTMTLPPASSLETTKHAERNVRAILRTYPEVHNIVTQVGRPDDGTDPKGPNNLEILADLNARSSWRFASKEALIADMARRLAILPGVQSNFSQVIQDNVEESLSGVKGEIAVKVFGPDLEILEDKVEQIASILKSIRGAADVAAIKVGGQAELAVSLDRARLARYGITVNDANALIQTAVGGNAVSVFYEGDRRFDITVRLAEAYRDAVDDIANLQLPLPAPGGDAAPATLSLGDVASIEVRQGAARVSRERGGRNASVKANLRGRDQGSFVGEARERVAREVHLPPGYSVTWGGQFENQSRAAKRLRVIVPVSALIIFSLLFWAFRSVKRALLVLAMVPFTLIGGVAALAVGGMHLSISAAVGFIAVAGISVQNGVIMVERIRELARNGARMADAVVEGAVSRLRPILMTALMAGLGLLPAALSHGIGSETQRPFASVIVGGIVSATLFTLVLLPLLFPWFVRDEP